MSLLPYFFDYNVPQWPRRLLGQNFGLALTPEDLVSAATSPVIPKLRLWWPKDLQSGTGSSIMVEKDKWQINIDVQHFAPDEVTVKVADGYIVVEGKHEERQDEHGFISRQFVRRFKLPEDSDPDAIESRLSSDGVLSVLAPKKVDTLKGERNVPISHTGPVRKDVKDELVNVEQNDEK